MSVRIARVRLSKPTRLYAPANSRCQSALLGTAVAFPTKRSRDDRDLHANHSPHVCTIASGFFKPLDSKHNRLRQIAGCNTESRFGEWCADDFRQQVSERGKSITDGRETEIKHIFCIRMCLDQFESLSPPRLAGKA